MKNVEKKVNIDVCDFITQEEEILALSQEVLCKSQLSRGQKTNLMVKIIRKGIENKPENHVTV